MQPSLLALLTLFVLALSPTSQLMIRAIDCIGEDSYGTAMSAPQQVSSSNDDLQEDRSFPQSAEAYSSHTSQQQNNQAKWHHQQLADKIRVALRRYVASSALPYFAPQQEQHSGGGGNRIQTRSTASEATPQDAIIGKWLESTLVDTDGFKRSDSPQQQDLQTSASTASGLNLGASGLKTIRNIQPVLMRLPPRFGKRTC